MPQSSRFGLRPALYDRSFENINCRVRRDIEVRATDRDTVDPRIFRETDKAIGAADITPFVAGS